MSPTALSTALADNSIAATSLTEAEQQQVAVLVEHIDIRGPLMAIACGAGTMNNISRFAENLMNEVCTKDAGETGQQITSLLQKMKRD